MPLQDVKRTAGTKSASAAVYGFEEDFSSPQDWGHLLRGLRGCQDQDIGLLFKERILTAIHGADDLTSAPGCQTENEKDVHQHDEAMDDKGADLVVYRTRVYGYAREIANLSNIAHEIHARQVS